MFGLNYRSFGWVCDLGYIRSWCLHTSLIFNIHQHRQQEQKEQEHIYLCWIYKIGHAEISLQSQRAKSSASTYTQEKGHKDDQRAEYL